MTLEQENKIAQNAGMEGARLWTTSELRNAFQTANPIPGARLNTLSLSRNPGPPQAFKGI